MKKFWILFFLCFANITGYAQTTTYNYTGGVQTYTVPAGVTSITIDIRGANGGGVNCAYGGGTYQSIGGCGGRVLATLAVTPGQVLNVVVGGQGTGTGSGAGGYGGGGTDQAWTTVWPGAGGGGGTTITDNVTGTTLAVAGGGGGGGGDFCAASGTGSGIGDVGGAGGGLIAAAGNSNQCGPPAGLGGQGGTQAAGGAAGGCFGFAGNAGALGVGANCTAAGNVGSGAGGGGYYGGGSGGYGGGGGGGSSYTDATYATAVTNTPGYNCGNGIAIITVACSMAPITGASTSVCIGSSIALSDVTTGGVWSSSSTSIATVGATGVVTGVTQGILTITYTITATGCYAAYTDTVDMVPGTISGPTSVCTGSNITLSDASAYGTWSSNNSTAATVGLTTGIVTGGTGGSAVITYSNICGTKTTTITVNPTPGAIIGATTICPGSAITLSDAPSGGTWSSSVTTIATVAPVTGIVNGVSTGNSVITYTTTGSCTATATVTISVGPPAFNITPPSATFCSGYQMLTVPPIPAITDSLTFYHNTHFNIPQNGNVLDNIAVTGIPTGATINDVSVELEDVQYSDDHHLFFNIQAPDGKNLNLVNAEGGTGANFINTIIASYGSTALNTAAAPLTGTYKADAAAPAAPAVASNVTTWPPLYTTPNGNWTLGAACNSNAHGTAVVYQWSITISYTIAAGTYVWTPATGLYTNSGLTVAYIAGAATNTVYASPASTTTYTATASIPGYTCSSSSTATITIGGSAAITGTSAMCTGTSATLSASVGGGTWSSSNSAVATVTPAGGIISGVSAGTAVISYNSLCVSTTTITVTAPPGAISGTAHICSGGVTTTLSDAAAGIWSSNNSAVASVGSATGIVTSGVTGTSGTATITYSNGCGTAATTTFSVTPTPTAIIGTTTLCSGGATTILSDAIAGGTWSSSNSSVASVGSGTGLVTPGTLAGGTSGTTTITYANSCGSQTVTVTVTGPPGSITGATSICSGNVTTTLSDALGGTWSSASSSVASVGSLTGIVTSGVAGTSGTAVITYSNGCGNAVTTVTVIPGPASISGGPATICSGGAAMMLSDATAGGIWTSGTPAVASINSSTGQIISGNVATGSSGTTVITYSNGCGANPTTTITVNAPPGAISGNTGICAGAATTLSDATGGAWSSGSVAVATVGSLTGVVTGSAVTAVSNVTITYSNGCLPNAFTTVTVTPVPVAITGSTGVCTGAAITLSDAIAGGTWSSGTPANATVTAAGGVVWGVQTGTSAITYSNGCGSPVTTVTVSAAPTIITGATLICLGGTSTLSNNGVPVGTWTSSNSSVATVDPVTGVVSTTGTTGGTTTITAQNQCGSTNILFTVSNPTPITGVLTFCQDATTTLSNGVVGGTWSSGNIAVATTTGAVNGNIIYGTGPGLSSGTAPITYTLSTGCFTTTTVTTTPSPTSILGLGSVCAGSVVSLTDLTSGGVWTSSNTLVATVDASGNVHGINTGSTPLSAVINYTIGTCGASATVTVNPLPAAITGPDAVCVLSTITLSDATPVGTWSGSNTTASVNGATGAVTGATAGLDTITYKLLLTGCITTTTILVNPLPAAISGNMVICYGQTSQLSDATPLGTWSSSASTVANVTIGGGLVSTGPPALPAGGTTRITYTLPTGCIATTTFTVNPLPGVITGATSICAGATTSLTDSPAGGTWSSSNVAAATVGASGGIVTGLNVLSSLSTVITYSLSTGCTATTTVTVNPLPAAITGNLIICGGLTTQLSDITGGGTWTSGTVGIATVGSLTGLVTGVSTISIAGTTVITYTLPTSCSATTTVTVNPLPGAIIGSTAVCSGLTTSLTDATSGGTWSSSNTTAATIGVNSGLLTGGAVTTPTVVAVTYTLGTGCTRTINVTVNPLPAAITGTSTICAGLTTQLSDVSANGTWSSGTVTVATVGSSTGLVTGVNPGPGLGVTGTDVITYTLPTGCLATTTVTVNPLPALITGVTTICSGSTTQLTDVTGGGTWSSSVSSTATIGANSGLVTGGVVIYPSGPQTTQITYSLSTGCIATTTVTVNPLPTVISGNTTICAGLTTTLSNGSSGTWSSNNTLVATVSAGTGTTTIVTGGSVITQSTATVTITAGAGCTQSIVITVNPLPVPITGNTTICSGLTTQLSDGSTGGIWSSSVSGTATIGSSTGFVTGGVVIYPTGAKATLITYTLPTGCTMTTSVIVNPLPAAITGLSNVCATFTINLSDVTPGGLWSSSNTTVATVAGTGVVTGGANPGGPDTITYTLGTGCIATKTVSVNVQPAAVGGPLQICDHSSGMLSDATGGGIWTSGNTTIATVDASGTVTGAMPGSGIPGGTTNITYSIGSCSSAIAVYVMTQPLAITGIASMCSGSSVTLNDITPTGVWTSSNASVATVVPSIGGGYVTGSVVTAQSTDTITYTIGNCSSMMTVTVNVQPVPVTAATTSFCDLSSITLSDATPGGVWSSNNTNASVGSGTGIVTGTMPVGSPPGTAIITYTELIGGCNAARIITINTQPVPITGPSAVCNGDSVQLTDGTLGGVWSVDPSTISVATVNGTGLVTGLSAGAGGSPAIIHWTVGSCEATTTVTVNPLPSPVSGIFYICQNSTTTLGDLSPSGTWSSNTPAIASVNPASGVVYGVDTGYTMITYTLPTGCITTHTVEVIPVPDPITGNSPVCAGQMSALSDITFGGTWTSGNTGIATVGGGSGVVTGVSSGTAIISYTLGTGCSVVAPVIVNPLSPVNGITAVCVGQVMSLSDTTVGGTWSSSNAGVATVNQVTGVVRGVGSGPVYISYNLPTGCTATTTVTVNALPSPITPVNPQICDGLSIALSDATPGGVWSSGNVIIATVDPVLGIVTGSGNTGTSASAAVITYTSGCYITTTVTVDPLPQAITGNTGICLGLTSVLSDPTGGGAWSSSNAAIAPVNITGTVTGLTVGSATVSYTLITTGCITTTPVTVYPLPGVITGNIPVCAGSSIQLSDGTAGGAWFSSNPSVASVGFVNGVVTGESAGTAVITYQVATLCIETATVTVEPLPASISGTSNSVCIGNTLALYSVGGLSGTWSSNNTLVATIDSVSGVVTGVSSGTTLISYTAGSGCAATEVITVNPLPAGITGINTVCNGLTTYLSDATTGGAWSSSSPSIATVDPVTGEVYDVQPAGFVIITYKLPTGCYRDTPVTVNPAPALVSGATQVCQGSQIALSDAVDFGIGVWTSSNPGVATITPLGGILSGVSGGSVTVTYTLGGGSCFQPYTVTVNPLPGGISGILSVCAGLTTGLSDATPGGVWSSLSTSIATIDPVQGIVTGITAGTSEVSYTLGSGCASTATVTVNPLPAAISGNTNVCLGDTRTLSDSPSPGTWSSSNTNITTVGPSSGVVYGNSVGTDMITYTISATGCIMTTTVAVHPLPAIYTVTGGGSYCGGGSGVMIGLSGSQTGVEYLLYLGSTPTGTFMGTGSALSFGLQTTAGVYTVVALNTFTTCSNNMTGSAVITITPSPVPSVGISTGVGDTVCAGTTVTYTATAVNGGTSPVYQWSVNGTVVGAGSTYSYVPSNNNEIVVMMTSNMLCASPVEVSDTVRMTVLSSDTPSVSLLISPADTVCEGTAVTLTAAPSYGGYTPVYLWNVDGAHVGTNAPVYTYVPADGDIVYCRMVSDYRCLLRDTVSSAHEVITVDTPLTPVVSIVASPGWMIGEGSSDTLRAVVTNGGTSPMYQWYVNGAPVPGATTSQFVDNHFSYPNEDSVGCEVTGSGYCREVSFAWLYIFVTPAGVGQVVSPGVDLEVVPNPNNGTFTLQGTLGTTADEVVSLELTDVLGQVVYKEEVQTRGGRIAHQVIAGSTLANGMYMLSVRSASANKVFHVVIEQ